MKKFMTAVLVVAVLLVIGGITGNIFSNTYDGAGIPYAGSNHFRGGMMNRSFSANRSNQGEVMDMDELKDRVEDYIAGYDENLAISDIFVFEDSDYYFSIMEKDTGMGAMELLVNPYTGDVYPEFGPNMMWNIKYGRHNNQGYGMMVRGRGMTGGSTFEGNTISEENARRFAAEYLDKYTNKDYLVSDEGHEFHGYYTFHMEEAETTVGMLSVNGLTGDVWYHDWHGTLIEVIDGHSDDTH